MRSYKGAFSSGKRSKTKNDGIDALEATTSTYYIKSPARTEGRRLQEADSSVAAAAVSSTAGGVADAPCTAPAATARTRTLSSLSCG